jgi:hypothetical protein
MESLLFQPLKRPPHPRYFHEAGLRAYEQGMSLGEPPSHVVAVVSGPKDMARRFAFNSITVAGAAPELSGHEPDAPASRYSNLAVGST